MVRSIGIGPFFGDKGHKASHESLSLSWASSMVAPRPHPFLSGLGFEPTPTPLPFPVVPLEQPLGGLIPS